MTAIVVDEGTSAEKLYMGGGYNSLLGANYTEQYPKLLAVYDANAKTWVPRLNRSTKTWRLFCCNFAP